MPKMKTNAAAKKRFTFTGTGKIKRNLCYASTVSAADEAKIKSLLVK